MMSFDFVDVTSTVLDLPAQTALIDPVSLMEAGMSLAAALAASGTGELVGSGGSAAGQPEGQAGFDGVLLAGAIGLGEAQAGVAVAEDPHIAAALLAQLALEEEIEVFTSGQYEEPNLIGDDNGATLYLNEAPVEVPDGFTVDDLYAIEFVHDYATGLLTIYYHFSTDPADHGVTSQGYSLDTPISSAAPMTVGEWGGEAVPLEQNRGSKCTVTQTKTVTQNSGSYTVNFSGGLVSGTRTSGSTSTTTTRAVTIEGTLINGRCVVNLGR
jgi:hypothetical protein